MKQFITKTTKQYSVRELETELNKILAIANISNNITGSGNNPFILNINSVKPNQVIGVSNGVLNQFKDTIFEEIYNDNLPMGLMQIRVLNPECSYVAHKDLDTRCHIAIQTNPYSIITNFEDYRSYHIPADGHVYELNARKIHSAINSSNTPRFHLLWCKYECIPSETPTRLVCEVNDASGNIISWQQLYLVDIILESNIDIQELLIYDMDSQFKMRKYEISFSNKEIGHLFLEKIMLIPPSKNITINAYFLKQ